jgi:hypothetical protein
MHRSGTSALSGILRLLGFDAGTDLLRPDDFNPTGYFENQPIVRLNERILSHLGLSWADVFLPPHHLKHTGLHEAFDGEAKALLDKAFSGKRSWVLKDPRISMLIDFWLPHLRERNVSFIHLVRNPISVADSLNRRDGFPLERSLLLWFLQNLNAEFFTRGFNRCFINYEDFVSDWKSALGDAFRQLNLTPSRSFSKASADVERFISKGRARAMEAASSRPPDIGCKLVEEAFAMLNKANRLPLNTISERSDELLARFRDSGGLILRTLAKNDVRAELEAARHRISMLISKEVALKGKLSELQKRKMLLTERDAYRVREFLSSGIWRFWWLWVPISLIPVWIFD